MQLYVIAYGYSDAGPTGVREAIDAAASAFPALCGEAPVCGTSADGALRFATVGHPAATAAPRRPVTRRGDDVVLFDGLPIDRLGGFRATDADQLLAHWDVLPDRLEGMFSAVRVDLRAGRAEVVPDVLAMAHVYVHVAGRRWVVGNSIEAVSAVAGLGGLHPVGVPSLLTLGWPVCGSTPVDGIEQLPGGHVHRLDASGLRSTPTCTPAMLAPRRQHGVPPPASAVAAAMVRTTEAAGRDVSPLVCGVTAGRDTRVLMALARAAGWDARYYTSGDDEDVDVQFARRLTTALGLPYEVVHPEIPSDEDAWRSMTARFVAQTDGMSTLQSIDDWIDHQHPVDRVGLKLWGPGGEIGRAGNIGLAIPIAANAWGLRWSSVPQRWVLQHKVRERDLFRAEAVAATRAALDGFITERLEEGWRAREVLEAYYAFERVSNWAACGIRRASSASDLYSPFVSRDYIRWCFSLSPGERVVEAPHWRLLSELAPDLRDMPFEHPWRPQKPQAAAAMVLRDAGRHALRAAHQRVAPPPAPTSPPRPKFGARWLDAGRAAHLEFCLSHPTSPLWELVDRPALERALARPLAEQQRPARYWISVCNTLTAFWWFHGRGLATSAPLCVAA